VIRPVVRQGTVRTACVSSLAAMKKRRGRGSDTFAAREGCQWVADGPTLRPSSTAGCLLGVFIAFPAVWTALAAGVVVARRQPSGVYRKPGVGPAKAERCRRCSAHAHSGFEGAVLSLSAEVIARPARDSSNAVLTLSGVQCLAHLGAEPAVTRCTVLLGSRCLLFRAVNVD
jgi:hypothetical protein